MGKRCVSALPLRDLHLKFSAVGNLLVARTAMPRMLPEGSGRAHVKVCNAGMKIWGGHVGCAGTSDADKDRNLRLAIFYVGKDPLFAAVGGVSRSLSPAALLIWLLGS